MRYWCHVTAEEFRGGKFTRNRELDVVRDEVLRGVERFVMGGSSFPMSLSEAARAFSSGSCSGSRIEGSNNLMLRRSCAKSCIVSRNCEFVKGRLENRAYSYRVRNSTVVASIDKTPSSER